MNTKGKMTDKIRKEKGLYQSVQEHDACGIGMVVNIHGTKSHTLVEQALTVLENMTLQDFPKTMRSMPMVSLSVLYKKSTMIMSTPAPCM